MERNRFCSCFIVSNALIVIEYDEKVVYKSIAEALYRSSFVSLRGADLKRYYYRYKYSVLRKLKLTNNISDLLP